MSGVADTKDRDPLATLRTWSEDVDEQLGRISRSTLSHTQRTTIKSYFDQYKFDLPKSESVLIHGDLGADHILLNEQKQLTGIIDWSNHTKGCRYRDFRRNVAMGRGRVLRASVISLSHSTEFN